MPRIFPCELTHLDIQNTSFGGLNASFRHIIPTGKFKIGFALGFRDHKWLKANFVPNAPIFEWFISELIRNFSVTYQQIEDIKAEIARIRNDRRADAVYAELTLPTIVISGSISIAYDKDAKQFGTAFSSNIGFTLNKIDPNIRHLETTVLPWPNITHVGDYCSGITVEEQERKIRNAKSVGTELIEEFASTLCEGLITGLTNGDYMSLHLVPQKWSDNDLELPAKFNTLQRANIPFTPYGLLAISMIDPKLEKLATSELYTNFKKLSNKIISTLRETTGPVFELTPTGKSNNVLLRNQVFK